jgi:hypothetical protein
MTNGLGNQRPFDAVSGLALTVPPARRVQLAAFSDPQLTDAAYREMDLPFTVGKMDAHQRKAFAPEPSTGRFEYNNNMRLENYSRLQEADFAEAARMLLGDESRISIGSRFDVTRPRPQPGDEARIVHQLAGQTRVVADILRLDQSLCGGDKVALGIEFVQDRPMPWQGLASEMCI